MKSDQSAEHDQVLSRAAHGFDVAIAAMLGFVMLITFADVLGRYFMNSPIKAAYELTELMMGFIVFGGVASITRSRRHIKVDILDPVVSGVWACARAVVIDAIAALVLSIFTWQLFAHAVQAGIDSSRTQLIGIPEAPIFFVMAILASVSAFVQWGILLLRMRTAIS